MCWNSQPGVLCQEALHPALSRPLGDSRQVRTGGKVVFLGGNHFGLLSTLSCGTAWSSLCLAPPRQRMLVQTL